jgi:uncharacterized protein YuzE
MEFRATGPGQNSTAEVGTQMKPKGSVKYYPENDVLHVLIQAGEEAKSVEIEPGVTAELNKSGKIIGIEILDVSQYLQKLIQQRLEPQLRQKMAS